jgi:hypothetical protein
MEFVLVLKYKDLVALPQSSIELILGIMGELLSST